jgi:hypothetical protein
MFYWVIQEVEGKIYLHGPYKTSDARDNRFENVFGGEVHKFNSYSSDAEQVRNEFLDERTREALESG